MLPRGGHCSLNDCLKSSMESGCLGYAHRVWSFI